MEKKYLAFYKIFFLLFAFVTYGQNGSPNLGVSAGGTIQLCSPGSSVQLTATVTPAYTTSSYSVVKLTSPTSSFNSDPPTATNLTSDDNWSDIFPLNKLGALAQPFNFCFYGNTYDRCLLNTNGVISFSISGVYPGGIYSPLAGAGYTLNNPIPFNPGGSNGPYLNAIMGAFQDTDPGIGNPRLNFNVEGTYPNRAFIFNLNNVSNFSCASVIHNSQMVLYEGSNIIDVYIRNRSNDCGWQGGRAVIGLQDNTASAASIAPPGRNTGTWEVLASDPEAWRFTPNASPAPVSVVWKDGSGTQVGTGPVVIVNPMVTTTYTVEATYTICGLSYMVSDTVQVILDDIATGPVQNLTECDADGDGSEEFNLTENEVSYQNGLDPSRYTISYHLNEGDALLGLNPISAADVISFTSSGQTVWIAVEDFFSAFACRKVKPFDLIISDCTAPDLRLCDNDNNTTEIFDMSVQNAPILNGDAAADFNITYHATSDGANGVTTEVIPTTGPAGTIVSNFLSAGQTIYARKEPIANPADFEVSDFDLIVNDLPTITGTLNVCVNGTTDLNSVPVTTGTWSSNNTAVATVDANGVVTGVTAGTAVITFTDDNTCTSNPGATVTVNPLPDASIAANVTSVCVGGTSPVITFTGSLGTAPYTFTYTDATGTHTALSTGNTATVSVPTTTAGTYTYTLTNVQDSSASTCSQVQTDAPVTVTVNPLPEATIGVDVTSVCVGGTSPVITFTGSLGTAPYTFTYTDALGSHTVNSAGNTATITVPTTTAGTYTYTLTNVQDSSSSACSQVQTDAPVTVTVNPLPDATFGVDVATVCVGGTQPVITFTGSLGTAPYTFTYTDAAGSHTVNSVGNTATVTVPTTTAGTYTYTLTNVQDSSTSTCSQVQTDAPISVTVNPLPDASIAANVTSVCVGGTSPVITFTGSLGTAPYIFTYTDGLGTHTVNSVGNTATVLVPTTTAGTYTYTLTNVQDSSPTTCSQVQTDAPITITVNPLPDASIGVDVATVCVGGTSPVITFTGSLGTAPYTFTYTDAAGSHTLNSVGNTATVTVPTVTAGTYTYTLTNVQDSSASACSQVQMDAPIIVTVNPLPDGTIAPNVASVCVGGTQPVITFTGSLGTAPYIFTYTDAAGSHTVNSVGNIATVTVPTITAGTYTYTLTNVQDSSATACSQVQTDAPVTVTVNPLPDASIGVDVTSVCVGGTSPVITFTGSLGTAPYTFTYTDATGTHTAVSTGNTATVSVPTTTAGTYTYTLTNVQDSSSSTCSQVQTDAPVTVTVNTAPTVTIVNNGPTTICTGSQANIQITGTAGATVNYTVNTVANTVVIPAIGSVTLTPTLTANTTFNFVDIQNGCTTTIGQQITINVTPMPSGSISYAGPYCKTVITNQAVNFTGTPHPNGFYTVMPATGLDINTVTGAILPSTSTPNTYTVYYNVPALGGCSAYQSTGATVTILPAPAVTIVNNGPTQICTGSQANIQITGTPGATVNYTVNTVANSVVIPAIGSVTLAPTLTTNTTFDFVDIRNACTTAIGQQITINVTPMPSGSISYNGPYCITETTSQTVNFTGTPHPNGFYTVLPATGLSINATTGAIVPSTSTPNTYTVYYNVPALGGCSAYISAGASVTILPGPTATISYGSLPFCISSTGSVPVNQTGTVGGDYTSDPPGLSLNPSSGAITPSLCAPGTYTVYYTIQASGGCQQLIKQAMVTILEAPKPVVNTGLVCVDPITNVPFSTATLNSGLGGAYSHEWYFNGNLIGTSSSITVSDVGIYTLEVTNAANCSTTVTTSVTAAYPALASDASYLVSNYFYDYQAITVTVAGNGNYLYSLDGGDYQQSNVFSYVLPTNNSFEHYVHITDENGCTDITLGPINTVSYPKFFTPNGDGQNETWNIDSLSLSQPNAEITIFDRYGKLIMVTTPGSQGWDGTLNGSLLPSTDYWFTVKFTENGVERLFKAHFSMRR